MPSFLTPALTAFLVHFDASYLADGEFCLRFLSSFMRARWISPCITKSTFLLCDAETGFPPIEMSRDSEFVGSSVFARRKARAIIYLPWRLYLRYEEMGRGTGDGLLA